MKKHRRFWLLLSFAAQIVSYFGAVAMLFKKKKGTAGFLAALGFIGTLIAAAALDTVPDKTKSKTEAAADILRNAKRIHEEQETEEQIMSSESIGDDDDNAFYNSISEALDEINASDNAPSADADAQPDANAKADALSKSDDLAKIERAIDILKNAGKPSAEYSDDIGDIIDKELSQM